MSPCEKSRVVSCVYRDVGKAVSIVRYSVQFAITAVPVNVTRSEALFVCQTLPIRHDQDDRVSLRTLALIFCIPLYLVIVVPIDVLPFLLSAYSPTGRHSDNKKGNTPGRL